VPADITKIVWRFSTTPTFLFPPLCSHTTVEPRFYKEMY